MFTETGDNLLMVGNKVFYHNKVQLPRAIKSSAKLIAIKDKSKINALFNSNVDMETINVFGNKIKYQYTTEILLELN